MNKSLNGRHQEVIKTHKFPRGCVMLNSPLGIMCVCVRERARLPIPFPHVDILRIVGAPCFGAAGWATVDAWES